MSVTWKWHVCHKFFWNKANLRDLIAASLVWGPNWRFFVLCDLEIWRINNRVLCLCYLHHFKAIGEFKHKFTVWKRPIQVKISDFFCPMWTWKLMDDFENNRTPILCYLELCASFRKHLWIQTGVTVRKHPNQVKSVIFCPVWPWNLLDDLEKQ